ncbi:RlpA-like double-psi beta-barrel-protein domain-containing protein-containing protein [Zychaea mexicana]|uniref:RlpA-like double-psi beta-barrel-protein domain-containing protein-containing protein n=1 Tax=Zychaea mexicana TaxID=64656 RepID=UPI0022FE613B|nr:RlpA-like double-psi beta-barrel-protein domain-containing protein-containing protein [Zychaea mexicana]KAI9498600.1 RlpA-like double-psi beta-barrel-protein domain-containing protein-containing protein [Zychaea mexicana]
MRNIITTVGLMLSSAWMMATAATTDEEQAQQGTAGVMMYHQPFSSATSNGLSKRHARGTWYDGKDLKNAACYGHNGMPSWDATIHDMIGAMAMADHEQCNKCVEITNNKFRELSATIMIVDKCAACTKKNWIDLSPAAFAKLSKHGDLNIGVLDISWKTVPCSKVHGHLPPKSERKDGNSKKIHHG